MPYTPLTAKEALHLAQQQGDWKLPYMQFVDDFRRLPPHERLSLVQEDAKGDNEQYVALISSIVNHLCDESGLEPPNWSLADHWLKTPWFVSGVNSLYAFALLESPFFFRRNNIFVLGNFLDRC